jgi:hypothetical protein
MSAGDAEVFSVTGLMIRTKVPALNVFRLAAVRIMTYAKRKNHGSGNHDLSEYWSRRCSESEYRQKITKGRAESAGLHDSVTYARHQ